MRSPNKRSRSKSNRPKTLGNIVNRVFDSSGPEGKVRGTPQQIIEKYQFLARDAQLGNDRVAAENFQQHAEHYTRMLAQAQREQAAEQEARRQNHEDQRARSEDRGRQTNGQGSGHGSGNGAGQSGHQPNAAQAQPQSALNDSEAREGATRQSSGAFDVAASSSEDDSPLVVETPETLDRSARREAGGQDLAGAEDATAKPRNTRKPRAPKPDRDGDAPKPRRAPRKPREPKAAGGTSESGDTPSVPEMKSSAAE